MIQVQRMQKVCRSVGWVGLSVVGLSLAACDTQTGEARVAEISDSYPPAPRIDHTDNYFGESVADPYRWMEDLGHPDVQSWVAAQNALSEPYLEAIGARPSIVARLTELWDYERYGTPQVEGGTYFFTHNDGLQDQDVLYVAESLEAEPRVLVDPNGFSEDGTVSLAGYSISPDGSHLAYAQSDGGTDWRTWRIRDVRTGSDLDDEIAFTKFTSVAWAPDGSGFYYSRYPQGENGEGDGQSSVSIYFHTLDSPQMSDVLVYGIPDYPTRNPYPTVTHDGGYLVVRVSDGFSANALYYRRLDGEGAVVPLLDDWDALYNFVGNDGPVFYIHTNKDAPRWRIVAVDIRDPGRMVDVVPESDHALDQVSLTGGRFVAEYLQDARSAVRVFYVNGNLEREIELPGLGSVSGFAGDPDDTHTFYRLTSFTEPGAVYRYDLATGRSALWKRARATFDPDAFTARQVFVESRDGTQVPMFLVHRSDLDVSTPQPTLLYGYGGFNISLTPSFSVSRLVWMERGGVLAIANLRGGGEYGEAWHEAGTKTRKQNVFDDFIAAAEWLIDQGLAAPNTLAIQGGSNGGLLVGAVTLQRPELFGATLPAVGVMDMLRYHTASQNARSWSSDYGLSENEEEYRALRAYSPVHNVRTGVCYPPTLITTADHDDRVVPWHSFKFGAAVQAAQDCGNPVLVRVETRAGHGAGKPTWMRIEEIADQWAFLELHLGHEPTAADAL